MTPEDLEAIRAVVREELDAIRGLVREELDRPVSEAAKSPAERLAAGYAHSERA